MAKTASTNSPSGSTTTSRKGGTAGEGGTGQGNTGQIKATRVGTVESDKRDKTRKVVVAFKAMHPKYGKYVSRRTVLQVHDEGNESRLGDTVEVAQCSAGIKMPARHKPRGHGQAAQALRRRSVSDSGGPSRGVCPPSR